MQVPGNTIADNLSLISPSHSEQIDIIRDGDDYPQQQRYKPPGPPEWWIYLDNKWTYLVSRNTIFGNATNFELVPARRQVSIDSFLVIGWLDPIFVDTLHHIIIIRVITHDITQWCKLDRNIIFRIGEADPLTLLEKTVHWKPVIKNAEAGNHHIGWNIATIRHMVCIDAYKTRGIAKQYSLVSKRLHATKLKVPLQNAIGKTIIAYALVRPMHLWNAIDWTKPDIVIFVTDKVDHTIWRKTIWFIQVRKWFLPPVEKINAIICSDCQRVGVQCNDAVYLGTANTVIVLFIFQELVSHLLSG